MNKPADWGLPEKFREWRPNQLKMVTDILEALQRCRVVVACAPTGAGKSLVYMAVGNKLGGRVVVLTASKALQDQLLRDFGSMERVAVIKGKGEYPCLLDPTCTRELAPCTAADPSEWQCLTDCPYEKALARARKARVILTNYHWWVSHHFPTSRVEETIGPYPALLVLDEGHKAPQLLSDILSVSVPLAKTAKLSPPLAWPRVSRWAREARKAMKEEDPLSPALFELERLEAIGARVQGAEDWKLHIENHSLKATLPWPKKEHSYQYLLGRSTKVVMTSATILPTTPALMGITSGVGVVDSPGSFPPSTRPIIYSPSVYPIFVKRNMPSWAEELWISKIDSVVRPRLREGKGIIHAVSYERASTILRRSKYGKFMVHREPGETLSDMVTRFRDSEAPCILVSPAVEEGFDFPYDECRWQIVAKIPYPNTKGRLEKWRAEAMKEKYGPYIAMQRLVQLSGRGSRAEDDYCETIVVDASWTWFIKNHRSSAPKWWLETIQKER